MYLANPILLLGAFGLSLALLLLPWFYWAKGEAMKKSVNGTLTTLLVLGAAWTLLGTVMGFNHMAVHGDCLAKERMWAEVRAAGTLSVENQELEKQFIATCNTIIARYSDTAE